MSRKVTVRLKVGGGTAGHNGMRSVTSVCGNGFVRVRLGVGRPPGRQDPADYVLRRFRKDDWYKVPAGHVDVCNVPLPVRVRKD